MKDRLLCAILFGILLLYGKTVHAAEYTEILLELAQEGTIYTVACDGTGDFLTIQEGVNSVASEDTLLIYPGVYEENVVIENKTVNLVGLGAEYCILTASADNYHNIPLTVGAGRVYGLTICGTSTGKRENAVKDPSAREYDASDLKSIYAWQDAFPGYAVHADQPYSIGKKLLIENCRILSDNNQCVGIGSWVGSEITITDSELSSKGSSGCIFIHNTSYLPNAGVGNVIVKNSSLKSYACPYVMAVHSMANANPLYLTFQNVSVSAVAYESKERYNNTNMNTWYCVDQLENPEVQNMLREAGYYSAQDGGLVYRVNERQHREYKKALEAQRSLLNGWPRLDQGIAYFEKSEDMPIAQGRARHVIDIKNVGREEIGGGWCGLFDIYLTNGSYGNTLPEMNYPRIGAE